MKPRIYARAYPVIIQIKREEKGITAGEIQQVLRDRGFADDEIPTRATIGTYKPSEDTLEGAVIDVLLKCEARKLDSEGVSIPEIRKHLNSRFNVNYSRTAYDYWINGRPQKHRTGTQENLYNRCCEAIVNREIDEGEAIDWLVERGMDEDKAFDAIMLRFVGGLDKVHREPTKLRAVELPTRRSRLRKAA